MPHACATADAEPAGLVFAYGRHGKPSLRVPGRGPAFNLAHCGDRGLLAVMEHGDLGVDLERLRPLRNDLRIARRQLGARVAADLEALSPVEREQAFLAHWTALEACVKARGEGIFQRSRAPCAPVSFAPVPGWIAAVACVGAVPPVDRWKSFAFTQRGQIPTVPV